MGSKTPQGGVRKNFFRYPSIRLDYICLYSKFQIFISCRLVWAQECIKSPHEALWAPWNDEVPSESKDSSVPICAIIHLSITPERSSRINFFKYWVRKGKGCPERGVGAGGGGGMDLGLGALNESWKRNCLENYNLASFQRDRGRV